MKSLTSSYILTLLIIPLLFVGCKQINENAKGFPGWQNEAATAEKNPAPEKNNPSFTDCDLLNVRTPNKSQIVNYEGFRLAFNADNHTPDWVAWELLASETDGAETRRNKFLTDPDVNGCALNEDYTRSGYDRGHMCPAADQKWSVKGMDDCFLLTNICPQDHALNSGAWSTLEKKERLWALRDSALIIIAGPIYTPEDNKRIGISGVRVPSAFFKVIAAPYLAQPRGIAFVYPNMTAPGNMKDYSMSIRELEKITGFDFMYQLPDSLENIIESNASFTLWNKN